jgi:hypothetical protein
MSNASASAKWCHCSLVAPQNDARKTIPESRLKCCANRKGKENKLKKEKKPSQQAPNIQEAFSLVNKMEIVALPPLNSCYTPPIQGADER